MPERSLWPVGVVAALGAVVVTSQVYLWAVGGDALRLLGAAGAVILVVFAVRRDVLADDHPVHRMNVATAAAVMSGGLGLTALGITLWLLQQDAFGLPLWGMLMAAMGYHVLRRQRIRQAVPA